MLSIARVEPRGHEEMDQDHAVHRVPNHTEMSTTKTWRKDGKT